MNENENGVVEQTLAESAQAEETAVVDTEVAEAKAEEVSQKPEMTDNDRWKAARKRAEREAQTHIDEARRDSERLMTALKDSGFDANSVDDMLLQLRAHNEGVSVDDLKAEQDRFDKAVNDAPIVKQAREIVQHQKFADDLAKVKAAYPDVQADDIEGLGEVYVSLMAAAEASGQDLDPVVAYEAQMAQNRRTAKPAPPSTGSVTSTVVEEKEFFTSEELDHLTSKQLDDPVIYDKAVKSMFRLGR